MRIAVISSDLNLKGGTERQYRDSLAGLAARAANVTAIAARIDPTIPLPENVHAHPVDLRWVPKPLRPFSFSRRVARLLGRERFDAAYSLVRVDAPVVQYCGGTRRGSLAARPWMTNGPLDRAFSRFEERSYHRAKRVLASSVMIQDELVKLYGLPREQAPVVYPPIDAQRFHPGHRTDRDAHRAAFGFRPEQRVYAFVSTGHGRKGLELLRSVFATLPPEYLLAVAGTPTPEGPNLRSLGFVREVERLYAAVDFTILPAFYEPFGLVVAESLACGTPVIASAHVGAKETLRAGEGLVLEGFEPQRWAEALRALPGQRLQVDPDYVARNRLGLALHTAELLRWLQPREAVRAP